MKKINCLTAYLSPVNNDNIGHKVCKMLYNICSDFVLLWTQYFMRPK